MNWGFFIGFSDQGATIQAPTEGERVRERGGKTKKSKRTVVLFSSGMRFALEAAGFVFFFN